jgi:tRNA modification GTPase
LQRDQALTQMSGALSRTLNNWRDELIACLAHVEAVIDFGEDEREAVHEQEIMSDVVRRIAVLKQDMLQHLNDARRGERIRDGISVAIVGPPNAGKSTLLNALAQRYAITNANAL